MASLYSAQYAARQWIAGQVFRWRRRSDDSDRVAASIANPRAVLLVIAGMLGDTVMSLPVIAAARSVWPGTRLTLLGQRHNIALLEGCAELDGHIEAPYLPFSIRHQRELKSVKRQIVEGRFDVAILVLGDQFALMLAEAGVPVRVGVRGHALSPCLTHEYEFGSPRTWGPNERLNALRVLGFDIPAATPRMTVSAESVKAGSQALASRGLPPTEQYAVIHPFASTQRKWWPISRVWDLAAQLQRVHRLRPVLIGGPEARNSVSPDMRSHVLDATCLTIRELVGVIAGAALVISTDSGPFHIAGALGRPLVGLFRARYPDHAARYPQAKVVFGEDAACVSACEYDRCRAAPCRELSAIQAASVIAALDATAERAGVSPK